MCIFLENIQSDKSKDNQSGNTESTIPTFNSEPNDMEGGLDINIPVVFSDQKQADQECIMALIVKHIEKICDSFPTELHVFFQKINL